MPTDNPILEPAYILHQRDYRDTSLIVELFTERYGRLSAVAKGARSLRSPWRGILSPGVPLLVSCVGKNDLLTLTQAEPNGMPTRLQGKALFSLFYLNELLMYLLPRFDPHTPLYHYYIQTLAQLSHTSQIEIPLRLFEWNLLQTLGYGLSLDTLAHSDLAIKPDAWYQLDAQVGVMELHNDFHNPQMTYRGKTLQALVDNQLPDDAILLREAKRLTRQLLQPLLGNREIVSRSLFI